MAKFARILSGVVVEVVDLPADVSLEQAFHPELASSFVSCSGTVTAGYTYDGSKFKAPAVSSLGPDGLRAYSANKRFSVETGGVVFNGTRIDTSRDSQSMIANAHNYIIASGAASTKFKSLSGWLTLSAEEVKVMALAIGAHVQASFDAEAAIDALITNGAITDVAGIDSFGWPVNADGDSP